MTDHDDNDPTKAELEQRVNQLEEAVQQMLPSRRDMLKLGGGALVGAGLMEATTGSAKAGSQSVGTIGTTSNPVDIVAEDFTDHNGNNVMELPGDGSVSIDELQGNYPSLFYAIGDGTVQDVIDPGNTTTPLQDSLDAAANASRSKGVIAPSTRFTEAGKVTVPGRMGITTWNGGQMDVDYQSGGDVLLEIDGVNIDFNCPILLLGPGDDNPDGGTDGITFTGNHGHINFNSVRVRNITGSPWDARGNKPFKVSVDLLDCASFDAGNKDAAIILDGGNTKWFGIVYLQPTATTSGSNTVGVRQNDGHSAWGTVTIGGTGGRVLQQGAGPMTVNDWHYEPKTTDQPSTPESLIFVGGDDDPMTVLGGRVIEATDFVYRHFGSGQDVLVKPEIRTTPNTNIVEVEKDPTSEAFYFGPASDVTENNAGGTNLFRCLASAGTGQG